MTRGHRCRHKQKLTDIPTVNDMKSPSRDDMQPLDVVRFNAGFEELQEISDACKMNTYKRKNTQYCIVLPVRQTVAPDQDNPASF